MIADEHLVATLNQLLDTPTWAECRRFIESHPELTDGRAEYILETELKTASEPKAKRVFQKNLKLLRHCREKGLDAAFAYRIIPQPLREILTLLRKPSELELQSRIELAREGLRMVAPEINPREWAILNVHLANALGSDVSANSVSSTNQAIELCQAVLPVLLKEDMLFEWANVIRNLGHLYRNQSIDVLPENQARAARCYEQSLEVLTIEDNPLEWAASANCLGVVYTEWVGGDKADYFDRGVWLLKMAIEIRDKHRFPLEWADSQQNLAIAYFDKTHGNREESLKLARLHCEKALEVRTQETTPLYWARSSRLLARIYAETTEGDPRENMSHSLELFEGVMNYYHQQCQLQVWASCALDCAKALFSNQFLDHASSFERAFKMLDRAMEIFEQHEERQLWCDAADALSCAYLRFRGDGRAENLERALKLQKKSLRLREETRNPIGHAMSLFNIAEIYTSRQMGKRWYNLEKALSYYTRAERVFAKVGNIFSRIKLLVSIGNIYRERIKGNSLSNLLQARSVVTQAQDLLQHHGDADLSGAIHFQLGNILLELLSFEEGVTLSMILDAFGHALEVYDANLFPESRAVTLLSIGNAYFHATEGARGENLEAAISHYRQAASLYEKAGHQQETAKAYMNLAIAYSERELESRDKNQDIALSYHQRANALYSFKDSPIEWARNLNNMGTLYAERVRGDRAENLEKAIDCYHHALMVRTRESDSRTWSETMDNLATAYLHRIRDQRSVNVEKAIEAYSKALRGRPRKRAPSLWSDTQHRLGIAYQQRNTGLPDANRKQAMYHLRKALSVRDRKHFPYKWARTMLHLGNCYAFNTRKNRLSNLKKARDCYLQALNVITRDNAPRSWSEIQNNLGNVYLFLGIRNPQYFDQALLAYDLALSFFEAYGFPEYAFSCHLNIGKVFFWCKQWQEANKFLHQGLSLLEQHYKEATTGEPRRAEPEVHSELPVYTAYCLAQLGHYEDAVATLEKARMRERLALFSSDLDKRTHPHDTKIRDLELLSQTTHDPKVFLEVCEKLRAAQEAYIEQPDNGPLSKRDSWLLHKRTVLVKTASPLIYLCHTAHSGLLLMVEPEKPEPSILWLPNCSEARVNAILFDTDFHKGFLHLAMEGNHEEWGGFLVSLEKAVHEIIVTRLASWLRDHGYGHAFLVPIGLLGQLPLASAFGDELNISIVPSYHALEEAQQQLDRKTTPPYKILALTRPLPGARDLSNAGEEIEEIITFLDRGDLMQLSGNNATREALKNHLGNHSILHFSGHGSFDLRDPLSSALHLAGNDRLTIRDLLMGELDVSHLRLVVLGACQSGVIDHQRGLHEMTGFPTAFLRAGVPAVLSTLWRIDDASSRYFLARFYHHLLVEGKTPAEALHQSRIWIKNEATAASLDLYQKARDRWQASEETDYQAYRLMRYYRSNPNLKPFTEPYHWAGYVLTGI